MSNVLLTRAFQGASGVLAVPELYSYNFRFFASIHCRFAVGKCRSMRRVLQHGFSRHLPSCPVTSPSWRIGEQQFTTNTCNLSPRVL
ncbi:uncharacterized protein K460DRAFT_17177 [Cucurbitaria berberidis CBS 394.84]|uniref:Uncharacterized protein n=1 Tax=Cucurbitaria berberidis CBS 394.84 TaxID=1168544 RepID=A0A9P4LD79_9PLEO|nr:uncharacterized protein K460DRAFT_17177 [Cucurbitaria berberidis CBS 394.84]KAF1850523.1 hypothetical protein K460DRAFT_17177 [Cucurbitaria berberidis CBS 394.84]